MLHSARYIPRRENGWKIYHGNYTKKIQRRWKANTAMNCKSFQRIFVFFYYVSVLTVYFTKELKLNDSQKFHF